MRTVGAVLGELSGPADPFRTWLKPWADEWDRGGDRVPAAWVLVSSELTGLSRGVLLDPGGAANFSAGDDWLRGLLRVSRVLGDDDALMVALVRLVPVLKKVMVGLMAHRPDLLEMEDVPSVVVSMCWDELRQYRTKAVEPSRIAATVSMNTKSRCRWDYARATRRRAGSIVTVDLHSDERSELSGWGAVAPLSVEDEVYQAETLAWLRGEVEAVVSAGGARWSIGVETAFYLAAGAWVFGLRSNELAEATGLGSAQSVRDRLVLLRRGIQRRNADGLPTQLCA